MRSSAPRGKLRVAPPVEPPPAEQMVYPDLPPPHDIAAERGVLSSCLLVPESMDLIFDLLKPEHFYWDPHRLIFESMLDLKAKGEPHDTLTVFGNLKDSGKIAGIPGGSKLLGEIVDAAPFVQNVRAYARRVVDKARRRWMIATLQHMATLGYLPDGENDPDWLGKVVKKVTDQGAPIDSAASVSVRDAIRSSMAKMAKAAERGGGVTGVPTGYAGIDRITGGVHAKEVTLICAEEKHGKSSLMRQIAVNVASTQALIDGPDGAPQHVPQGVVICSLEMNEEEISDNMICTLAGLEYRRYREQLFDADEMSEYVRYAAWVEQLPIEVINSRTLTLAQMRARLKMVRADFERRGIRLSLVVVDTLQLMVLSELSESGGEEQREEQTYNRVAKGLGDIAIDFCVPVIVLSQVNEKGRTHGARSVQHHAQAKWTIRVDGVLESVHKRPDPLDATLKVDFHRHGPPDEVQLFFFRRWTRFSEGNMVNGSFQP